MTDDKLDSVEIRLARVDSETEYLIVDIDDSARLHVTASDRQACISATDGEKQASIVLGGEDDREVETVVSAEEVAHVEAEPPTPLHGSG